MKADVRNIDLIPEIDEDIPETFNSEP